MTVGHILVWFIFYFVLGAALAIFLPWKLAVLVVGACVVVLLINTWLYWEKKVV